ncbi:BAR domain-containing protein [Colletotrichum graminicola]|uniref:BAR domain-containing protein n=1 Tax=Colletotrichum graminicola (strain M1.001 / M2 / FGSC 10212) TaxID=645133 RepID=E3Q518_COLGM|nr:BAR domain-containing protein [Colletotrichum graminicola M1.001]EFQ25785.1 BAR domain-containing protein [Colletotrichum graminicola M1.001]WDK22888.1 BAR domain-containing protein [Colletotrichum graminicola]
MNFTKKFDRAFQWAGEKMGSESKTGQTDEFRNLEMEMQLRYDGMERLQKSTNTYVKWIARRGEAADDKEKGLPIAFVGRMMISHGEEFEPDSEFGTCLLSLGRTNERLAGIQENYAADITDNWLISVERSLAMMKEYQAARKKLESRRLAYDASISKMQKAKREDFRLEEELRTARAKYEEAGEDVMRRMQDIKDAEADNVRDLTGLLDAELSYHERCAEELRRLRQNWAGNNVSSSPIDRRNTNGRGRSNTTRSFNDYSARGNPVEEEPEPMPVRMPIRSNRSEAKFGASADTTPRPSIARSQTFQGPAAVDRRPSAATPPVPSASHIGSLRGNLRPTGRPLAADVFADRDDDHMTGSGSGSPEWNDRCASPATSMGSSLNRSTSNLQSKKAPPPPPPSRAKKPAPPIPAKREVGY